MWHISTIEYGITDEKGNYKAVSEKFLQYGVTYGDVEAQLVDMLRGRVGTWETPAITRFKKRPEVIFNSSQNPIYKVKAEYDSGDDKKQSVVLFVPAESIADAEAQVRYYYRTALTDYTPVEATRTKLKGIYDPKNEIWVGDFRNRMEALKDAGKTTAPAKKKVKEPTLFDN
ncbi:hypothetical protein GCM10028803_00130 [Larkinella knui]|uniref:DUF4494 domain-containing protein n=1 Tax=Larkinella knui TaxID=2025310 RepID=A0A3P1CJ87_9BACT|nr:DUF4494 family protein [Larkinella knui]RRB13421.1 DUF4494 domain-containing protein [Larkinella knui]